MQRSTTDWPERQRRLTYLSDWGFSGKIAAKNLHNNKGTQANLSWQQSSEVTRLKLSGPFGAGAVEVNWSPVAVEVTDSNGKEIFDYVGPGARAAFLAEQLGWPFPADSLRYWVLGIPDPTDNSQASYGADGNLEELRQAGWTIRYSRFMLSGAELLPARLELNSADARLKLVVSRWRLAATHGVP